MKKYQFLMIIQVDDEDALRAAALARYLEENLGRPVDCVRKEWNDLRSGTHNDPVAADLQELLDPGKSPPGTDIQYSVAKCL